MRFMVLATACAIGLLSSSHAAADPAAAADFGADCLTTHGDQQRALAAADAAGWVKIDQPPPSVTAANFKMKDYAMRASSTAPSARVLVVGSGEAPMAGKSVPARICVIAGKDLGGSATEVKAALHMEPFMTMNVPSADAPATMNMFMFRDTPSGRTTLLASDLTALRGADGTLREPVDMVMTMEGKNGQGMVAYIALTP